MFTPAQRERVFERLVAMARADPRVSAAAVVGSRAGGEGDRWSDLDLAFALAPGAGMSSVLVDWTAAIERELGAVTLFDVPFRLSLYRVFLLPGQLQLDVSFTPGAEFGALGPGFRLLFGEAVERPAIPPPDAAEMLGMAVHRAVRARACVERGRVWQAEYWISGARDLALSLACLRHGLDARHARGCDALPADLVAVVQPALVRSLEPAELRRALGCAVEILAGEAAALGGRHVALVAPLRELLAAGPSGDA